MSDLSSQTHAARDVWNDGDDEMYRRDQSHWRGVGRWRNDGRWQSIGKQTLQGFDLMHRYLSIPMSIVGTRRNILEWGPGGGTNLFALAPIASKYYGVDVSTSNLEECTRMIEGEGHNNVFCPILVQDSPAEVSAQVADEIDLFVSTAVFQHFPSKAYGESVLRVLYSITSPKALGIIQIRYDNNNPKYRPIESLDEYKERHITANSYMLDEFHDLANSAGFDVLFIKSINSNVNYATFHLRRK
ncbi:MAG: class I SAM-dependent methyltransferase [Ilumatobacter sp.]|uniref:class I SAM-dependent methyltransferase n=1 Tax=Bacteria TaxID=2 RepID=UPI003298DFAD